MQGFLTFFVRFAYFGIVLALAGLVVFARYRKYSEDTGESAIIGKSVGIGIFALGMLWVIVPFFIRLGTGNL